MAEVKVKVQPPDADPVEIENRWSLALLPRLECSGAISAQPSM
uniref:RNA polymerase III subunit F n=1 Tax=Homo sapiens TaxID=9606 RepID=A0A8V8TMJ7_HUMAN